MNLQPTLLGDRVILQPLKESDFERLFEVASDPLIWKMHPETTRFERPVFEKYFAKAIDSKGAFLILDKETGEWIGSSRYYDYSPEEGKVKIGYTFYARKFWGGVYNSEIKSLMLRHAFENVEKVLFEVGENNLRSRKALEKIGARYVSTQSKDGANHCTYEISSSTFRGDKLTLHP